MQKILIVVKQCVLYTYKYICFDLIAIVASAEALLCSKSN